MIIPEILEYLEEADLEDWLTAAFIENERQLPLDRLMHQWRSPVRQPHSRYLDGGVDQPNRETLERSDLMSNFPKNEKLPNGTKALRTRRENSNSPSTPRPQK